MSATAGYGEEDHRPGGDSGIGRAVAIALAREGADVLIAYLEEDEDAAETARRVEQRAAERRSSAGTSPTPHTAGAAAHPHGSGRDSRSGASPVDRNPACRE